MKKKQFADINVTPFVDVMLVLLIIFMVTTPLMKKSLTVDLPEGQAQDFNAKSTDILLTLKKNGDLFIDDEQIDTQNLDAHLTSRLSKTQSKLLYLQADKTLTYGTVMNMMGRLHKMGYKISLVMLPLKA